MKTVSKYIDDEGFEVVSTVEVMPKIDVTFLNGVRIVTRVYKDGGRTVTASCECMGSDFRTHSRDDCHNRLRILAKARGSV